MGILAVVELPLRSGLPKDKIVNTYAIGESAPGSHTGVAALKTALGRVYTASVTSMGGSLGMFLSPAISRVANACAIKLYDVTGHLDGSPHGSPFDVSSFTMPAALGSTPLPEEVAFAVTLEAHNRGDQRVEVPDGADPDAKPDRPRQRFTGRVYLGPWAEGVEQADSNGMCRPNATTRDGCRDALKRFADELDTNTADALWLGVWSRKDQTIREVEFLRTDDAWDTQRRRGASPTSIVRTAVADVAPIEIELAS